MFDDSTLSTFSASPKKARIEIIPLIDVIFFLLATFVLFTLSLNKIYSLDVTLPVGGGESDQASLILQVSEAGTVYWDKELITKGEVPARLQNYAAETKLPRVLIASDERASYGDTILILDEVRKVGIKEVSMETMHRGTGR